MVEVRALICIQQAKLIERDLAEFHLLVSVPPRHKILNYHVTMNHMLRADWWGWGGGGVATNPYKISKDIVFGYAGTCTFKYSKKIMMYLL